MTYLLLIIGLILIYFSLKPDKHTGKKNSFSNMLQSRVDANDIEGIKEELKYLSDRVENIESSLLLFEKELHYDNLAEDTSNADEIINTSELKNENSTAANNESDLQERDSLTLNDTLYKLYDEGRTIDEISSITRIGKGEILLRLGLRKQKE